MTCQLLSITALALLALAGCGGSSSVSKTSTVTGTVLDINNQPVRDAVVSSKFGSARTSTTGAFILQKQGDGPVEYSAVATRNGVRYSGRTRVWNFKNERTQSANIVIGIEGELGSISGRVEDRNGDLLENASVYAYNGAGSSMRTFSDKNGEYIFRDLPGGLRYTVLAGGLGLRSDTALVDLGLDDARTVNFVVDDPGDPNLQPPTGVSAVSWVSTSDATRSPGTAIERIKRLVDPRYKGSSQVKSRATNSTLVEVDLQWTEQRFGDLFGYGIYRGSGDQGSVSDLDLLPEPLAAYYVDLTPRPRSTYGYAVTTISTRFPDDPTRTESDLSDVVIAKTLDKLDVFTPTQGPLTFRWGNGSAASTFAVFLFEEFPNVEVDPIWDNSSNRASGTSVVYSGPVLEQGKVYYFVVIGFANNDDSRTISQIGSFRMP
ncbi:MAG: carboxypeptidase regulatory-like domain-containing protein [Chthonomonadaceae bacterium]|nr:carboxypeptidase regulatory-like domain-containing protein [Chthonomonadaceae bacterium]